MPEYLWRVAEYIGQAGKWQGTATGLLSAAGVDGFPKEYHLHTLRHYYATYFLQEGTSKQVAADLLGHADTAFLERTYCHTQNMAKREAANLMEDLLSPKNIYYQPFKFVLKGKKVG